jgi:hypothetical protein
LKGAIFIREIENPGVYYGKTKSRILATDFDLQDGQILLYRNGGIRLQKNTGFRNLQNTIRTVMAILQNK